MRGVVARRHDARSPHFDDLCALLRGRHSESGSPALKATGPRAPREVIEKLVAHPCSTKAGRWPNPTRCWLSLMGGKELAMAEVNRVMTNRRQCDTRKSSWARPWTNAEKPFVGDGDCGQTRPRFPWTASHRGVW